MGTVRQDDQWWGGNYSLVGEDERRSGQDVVNFCFVIGRFSLCPLLPDSDDYGDLQEVQKATRCKTGGIQSFPASSLRGINCTVDSLFFLHCNVNDPLSLRWWWRRRRDWQQRLAFPPTRKLADQTYHETETR